VGQEFRDWQLGHICLLQLQKLVQPLKPSGGRFFTMSDNPNLLLSPRLVEAKEQGAATAWAHFSNLPGLESGIAILLGLVDAVELMTYNDPTQLPSHWAPWDYSELSQVEFTTMRGMDLYYQYLNAGLQVPITAGTDKMGDNIPVGSNRFYGRLAGDASYDNWIDALKAGRGFVSNSPMLTFAVDEHLSGETVTYSGKKTVMVRATAESILPYKRLEIVANGKLVAWEDMTKGAKLHTTELVTELALERSTWIAARVTSLDAARMLPRGLTTFAHSNPVYFLQNGKSVRVAASVNYLKTYLKSTHNWLEKHAKFATSTEQEEARDYLARAVRRLSER
jgi:hypothetical protein